jgi:hypothetical protein
MVTCAYCKTQEPRYTMAVCQFVSCVNSRKARAKQDRTERTAIIDGEGEPNAQDTPE